MIKNIWHLFLFTFLLLGDLVVIYGSLYAPYAVFFMEENQPWNLPDDHPWSGVISLVVMLANLLLFILFVLYLARRERVFYLAPLVTLFSLLLFFTARWLTPDYPSSISSYTEDGYRYKMEIWWGRPDGQRIYKRWKSTAPFHDGMNEDHIPYQLDSLSISPE